MTYSKILTFIKRYTTEYFPTISFREGTAAYDLFVKGFAILARGLLSLINNFIATMDPRNYNQMSKDAMDRLAALWFLSRRTGDIAHGDVRIYLSEPSKVQLNSGFVVTSSGGLEFSTTTSYSYSLSQIAANKIGNRYYFDIHVYGRGKGIQYNIPIYGITDIKTSFYLPWVEVKNFKAFSGGGDEESNEDLYYRIYNSANTRNLLITKNSVESTLLSTFGEIADIEVLGYGDDGMDRDIVYDLVLPEGVPYKDETFYRKSRGNITYNPNVARRDSYELLLDDSDNPILPDVDDLYDDAYEYEQEDYDAIGMYDLVYYEHSGGIIFYDSFDNDTGANIQTIDDWVISDSGLAFGNYYYGDSVSITVAGKLRLGANQIQSAPIGGI